MWGREWFSPKKKKILGIERIHANISFHWRQKNKERKSPRKQNKFLNFTDEKEMNKKYAWLCLRYGGDTWF